MVELLIIGAGVLIVVAVALVAVGGGVAKTSSMPKQIVYNVEESIDFCAEAMPDDVTATLSYDDLRIALRLHLEWIQAYHFTPEGLESPLVFQDTDALDYLMERADIVGLDLSRAHGRQVMDAHYAYFQFMGAIHLEDPAVAAKDLADAGVIDPGDVPPELQPGDSPP